MTERNPSALPRNTEKVKSLAKAMRVLECFLTEPETGVTQISEKLGLYKSNVHDILATFASLGYIEQNAQTGRYHLGMKLLEYSHTITASMGFRKTVFPHMQSLADSLGETVYLGVPDGGDVLYLDAAYPSHAYATRTMLGARAEMYCTGIGKAILSHMPEDRWKQLLPEILTAYTDNTLINHQALKADLRMSRSRGYSVDNMEHEYGIKCVGVPILNAQGQPTAGISISGPSLRFEDATLPRFAQALRIVALSVGNFFP